eukprot:14992953-Alexandrium_andersonii.AAC.1
MTKSGQLVRALGPLLAGRFGSAVRQQLRFENSRYISSFEQGFESRSSALGRAPPCRLYAQLETMGTISAVVDLLSEAQTKADLERLSKLVITKLKPLSSLLAAVSSAKNDLDKLRSKKVEAIKAQRKKERDQESTPDAKRKKNDLAGDLSEFGPARSLQVRVISSAEELTTASSAGAREWDVPTVIRASAIAPDSVRVLLEANDKQILSDRLVPMDSKLQAILRVGPF